LRKSAIDNKRVKCSKMAKNPKKSQTLSEAQDLH